MLSYERREEIISYLSQHKSATIEELSRKIFCSPSTVRRDLNFLQEEGQVRRTRGGVIYVEKDTYDPPYSSRMIDHFQEKQLIAGYAEPLIEDNMTLFMDSSSTCTCLARKLKHFNNIKLLTNSPLLVYELSQDSNVEVYCAGGKIYPKTNTLTGGEACKFIMQFHSDIFFTSCRGIDGQTGPTDFIGEAAQVKSFFSMNSTKTALLIDSSKFNHTYNYKTFHFSELDYIICDKAPDSSIIDACKKNQVELIY